jgi:hypothetical protein
MPTFWIKFRPEDKKNNILKDEGRYSLLVCEAMKTPDRSFYTEE